MASDGKRAYAQEANGDQQLAVKSSGGRMGQHWRSRPGRLSWRCASSSGAPSLGQKHNFKESLAPLIL